MHVSDASQYIRYEISGNVELHRSYIIICICGV